MTVNLTRIYTRLGDGGETHLGDMSRVAEDAPADRGLRHRRRAQRAARRRARPGRPARALRAAGSQRVQNDLFDVGADISVPEGGERERLRVIPEQTAWLEQACDEANAELPALKSFVLPGGTLAAAQLHVCRTVCRRAERRTIACGDEVNARVRALPQPALGPAVHPLARGECRRRAAPSRCGSRDATAEHERAGGDRQRAERRTSCSPPRRRRPPPGRESTASTPAAASTAPAIAGRRRARRLGRASARSAAVARHAQPVATRKPPIDVARVVRSRGSGSSRRCPPSAARPPAAASGRSATGLTITSASARLMTAVVWPLGHASGPMKCPTGISRWTASSGLSSWVVTPAPTHRDERHDAGPRARPPRSRPRPRAARRAARTAAG